MLPIITVLQDSTISIKWWSQFKKCSHMHTLAESSCALFASSRDVKNATLKSAMNNSYDVVQNVQ